VSGLRSDYPTERASGIAGDKLAKRGTALFNGGIVAVSDAFRPEPSIDTGFAIVHWQLGFGDVRPLPIAP